MMTGWGRMGEGRRPEEGSSARTAEAGLEGGPRVGRAEQVAPPWKDQELQPPASPPSSAGWDSASGGPRSKTDAHSRVMPAHQQSGLSSPVRAQAPSGWGGRMMGEQGGWGRPDTTARERLLRVCRRLVVHEQLFWWFSSEISCARHLIGSTEFRIPTKWVSLSVFISSYVRIELASGLGWFV